MTHPPIPSTRAIFNMAWPLGLKATMLFGVVVIDAYLASSLGESAVAVLGLSASIAGLLLGVIAAFSTATQIRIAQAFGAGDNGLLKSALGAGVVVNIAVAAIGLFFLSLAAGFIIDRLAHDAWIADQARRYLLVFAMVILAEAVALCLTSFFNGCGKTRLPLYSYLLTVPVNVGVSFVLIHGVFGAPEMGVVGAAIGSALAAALRAGFLTWALWIKHRSFFTRAGVSGPALGRHLRFSLPIAATFASTTVVNSVCGLLYATLPINQFAAMTLIAPWIQVVGVCVICWAQATGIIVAQLLGRRRPAEDVDAFLSSAWRAVFLPAALASAVYACFCLSAPWIYANLHQETQMALLSFLPILVVLPFPKGSNAICGNTLRAAGETVYVMHVFLWSQWLFRVPATAAMTLYFELSATWLVLILLGEELVKFAPFHLRLHSGAWKRRKIRE